MTDGATVPIDDAAGQPDIIITREMWDDFSCERMTERGAYLWLGVHGPVRNHPRRFASEWQWSASKVAKFLRKMEACGLIIRDGKDLVAVHTREAVRHPDLIVGESWRDLRLRVFVRDGFTCTYCGAGGGTELHCDHIVPRARGGLDVESNLTTACQDCNLSKGAKSLEDWQASRERDQ